jgi:DNA repair exonuclease SbcCD ATPase subunit
MWMALGFAIAAFIALFSVRFLWDFALRLGANRSRSLVPANMVELQADRDRLRAEYAMLSRKLELRIDDLKTRNAEQTAEVSRNRNRIETLLSELGNFEKENHAQAAEIKLLQDQNAHLEKELTLKTQTLQTSEEQNRAREEAVALLKVDTADLRGEIESRDRQIAVLRSEAAAVAKSAWSAQEPEFQLDKQRLKNQIEALNELSQQIAVQRLEISQERSAREMAALESQTAIEQEEEEPVNDAIESLEKKLIQAEEESKELASELQRLDDSWSQRFSDIRSIRPAARIPTFDDVEQEVRRERSTRDVANVVSLAARIRSLQKDIGR